MTSDKKDYTTPNTRPIPILITLAGAGISCVVSILKQLSFGDFVWKLLTTVIIFGILGSLVRVFLDMGFKVDKKEEKDASEAEDEEAEKPSDDSDEESDDEKQTQE